MANVLINTAGNPWLITTTGGVTALPATVLGVQNTGNIALPFLPKRIVWVSKSAAQDDGVVLKDLPGIGGTGTQRVIAEFFATGADYTPPQEWKRSEKDAAFVGLQITQFDSGDLYIYV